jgi:transposase-like protein
MTSTFLHEDKIVPPDEEVDLHPPACPACGATMWLVHFKRSSSDEGQCEVRSYQCKTCGALKNVIDGALAEASP